MPRCQYSVSEYHFIKNFIAWKICATLRSPRPRRNLAFLLHANRLSSLFLVRKNEGSKQRPWQQRRVYVFTENQRCWSCPKCCFLPSELSGVEWRTFMVKFVNWRLFVYHCAGMPLCSWPKTKTDLLLWKWSKCPGLMGPFKSILIGHLCVRNITLLISLTGNVNSWGILSFLIAQRRTDVYWESGDLCTKIGLFGSGSIQNLIWSREMMRIIQSFQSSWIGDKGTLQLGSNSMTVASTVLVHLFSTNLVGWTWTSYACCQRCVCSDDMKSVARLHWVKFDFWRFFWFLRLWQWYCLNVCNLLD